MIEWYGTGGHTADCGDLTLETFGSGFTFRAVVSVNGEPLLDGFDYPTLDAAKLAAEEFARSWIARQAAALGGGWVYLPELPDDGGPYHVAVSNYDGSDIRHGIAWFREAGWRSISDDQYEGDYVIAWQALPLPELPRCRR